MSILGRRTSLRRHPHVRHTRSQHLVTTSRRVATPAAVTHTIPGTSGGTDPIADAGYSTRAQHFIRHMEYDFNGEDVVCEQRVSVDPEPVHDLLQLGVHGAVGLAVLVEELLSKCH